MFKIDEEGDLSYLSKEIAVAENNYLIQANDLIEFRVYTNKGEQIIDPNNELQIQGNQNSTIQNQKEFLVLDDGTVKLPLIGIVNLLGMKISDAEDYLEKKYNEYYKDAFVRLKYTNKRIIVLGSTGGQVISLENENTSLIEVVALAGGIDQDGKAHNLRLIRGDLHEPEVFLIDLSTIEGMKNSMMEAMPGDIIYIEPKVKILTEGARDFMTVFSVLVNTVALVALIINLTNNN